MTSVTYVTGREMKARTGMPALGYATSDGNILIRKGLSKALERKVREHEAEHVRKGEEGPFLGAAIGGALISGILGSRASDRAADAQTQANQAAIEEQRRQFNTILDLTQPQRQVGNQALSAISQLLGLPGADESTSVDMAAPGGGPRFNVGPFDFPVPGSFSGGEVIPGGASESVPFDAEMALENIPGNEVIVNDAIRRITQASPTTGGNVLQELADRVSGFQSDRLFNSLFQLAGFGPQGTSTAAAGAGRTGNSISRLLSSSGAANASGILGGASSINSGAQNIMQSLMLRNLLNQGGAVTPNSGLFNPAGSSGLSTVNMNALRGLRV